MFLFFMEYFDSKLLLEVKIFKEFWKIGCFIGGPINRRSKEHSKVKLFPRHVEPKGQ